MDRLARLRRFHPSLLAAVAAACALLVAVPPLASAAPTAEDCAVCHTIPESHSGSHRSPALSANVELFSADHEGAGSHVGIVMDCGLCHDLDDVSAIHDDHCATCHPSPRDTVSGWENGCQQGACHPTIHGNAVPGHVAAAQRGYTAGCLGCHDYDTWAVSPGKCGTCHTLVDHIAPVTSADDEASYVGPASVRLSASDLPSPGGSRVAHTYWSLDGAPRQEGSLVSVPSPSSGTASHTLEFWSVDGAGNAESHHVVGFTVAADTQAPSTTSDVRESYFGPAAIKLTATDDGTGEPVTYYRLDGAAAASGTIVSVAQPSSGSVSHTLEFWSVDAAGNIESPRTTVSFTVAVDTTPPQTTSNAVPFYRVVTADERITLSATDTGSGVAATYYRMDGGTVITGSIALVSRSLAAGPHTLEFWSVDRVGNIEAHHTASFTIDRTPPSTASDAQPVYSGSATIHLSASDNAGGSGVADTYYRLDGGAQATGTVLTVPSAGAHVLESWSVDRVGNAESPHRSVGFTVLGTESTPPVTSSDASASYVSSATIRLTATDGEGGSGVKATYYELDGGARTSGNTIAVFSPGSHTLEFWSVDNAGNEESPHKTAAFSITVPEGQGTIRFAWNDVPPGSWTYYYVYDADGTLVASSYNTTGWFIVNVPVSSRAYSVRAYWLCVEDPGYPVWSYGSALIDTSGKVYTWWY